MILIKLNETVLQYKFKNLTKNIIAV